MYDILLLSGNQHDRTEFFETYCTKYLILNKATNDNNNNKKKNNNMLTDTVCIRTKILFTIVVIKRLESHYQNLLFSMTYNRSLQDTFLRN